MSVLTSFQPKGPILSHDDGFNLKSFSPFLSQRVSAFEESQYRCLSSKTLREQMKLEKMVRVVRGRQVDDFKYQIDDSVLRVLGLKDADKSDEVGNLRLSLNRLSVFPEPSRDIVAAFALIALKPKTLNEFKLGAYYLTSFKQTGILSDFCILAGTFSKDPEIFTFAFKLLNIWQPKLFNRRLLEVIYKDEKEYLSDEIRGILSDDVTRDHVRDRNVEEVFDCVKTLCSILYVGSTSGEATRFFTDKILKVFAANKSLEDLEILLSGISRFAGKERGILRPWGLISCYSLFKNHLNIKCESTDPWKNLFNGHLTSSNSKDLYTVKDPWLNTIWEILENEYKKSIKMY